MKKLALFICLISISFTFSQTTTEDLIGKWELLTLTIDGTVFTAFEAFETNTFYHEYFEDKTFRNTVDVYTGSGTWELSGERLNQFYTTESGELHFKVLEISDDELHLLITNENLNIIFTFKKV
jgi:hypothetical protein